LRTPPPQKKKTSQESIIQILRDKEETKNYLIFKKVSELF
jgi:hypothetical protein